MAFCLAPEVSKAQPSLLLALSAQGNKPLTTRVQEGLLLDSRALLLGWGGGQDQVSRPLDPPLAGSA